VSPCQILWQSVKWLLRYGDFSIFPRRRPSAILDLWCTCLDHPRRALGGLYCWSCNFEDMWVSILCVVGLEMPIHAPFWGTFPPNDVTHRPNPKKDHPWAESRHLSYKARISVARFELGVGTRKKKDRTGKKSKGLYFTYLWRSSRWSDVHEKLFSRWWGDLLDILP